MMDSLVWCFTSLLLVSFFHFSSGEYSSSNNISSSSFNSLIRDGAFKILAHQPTGIISRVPLPMNLSGIEASGVKLRSRSLWRLGVDIGAIHVLPGAISKPHVQRLIIVYESFGNRSSSVFHVPAGFSLVTPVVGFQVYDASNTSFNSATTELDLNVTRTSISVSFSSIQLPKGSGSKIKCASFGLNGSVSIYHDVSSSLCLTRSTGHFGIVVSSEFPGSETEMKKGGDRRKWRVWLMVCVCGVVGLFFACLVGKVGFTLARNKKMRRIERRAENDEALGSVWVGRSKMPSASMVRTQPVIETESAP